MKRLFQSSFKLPLNLEYRKLRKRQKIAYAAFRNTSGDDRNSMHVREMAKKEYDIVSVRIASMKEEARIKKITLRNKKSLIA